MRILGISKLRINNNFLIRRNIQTRSQVNNLPVDRPKCSSHVLFRGEKLLHVSTVYIELIDISRRRDCYVPTFLRIRNVSVYIAGHRGPMYNTSTSFYFRQATSAAPEKPISVAVFRATFTQFHYWNFLAN